MNKLVLLLLLTHLSFVSAGKNSRHTAHLQLPKVAPRHHKTVDQQTKDMLKAQYQPLKQALDAAGARYTTIKADVEKLQNELQAKMHEFRQAATNNKAKEFKLTPEQKKQLNAIKPTAEQQKIIDAYLKALADIATFKSTLRKKYGLTHLSKDFQYITGK